MRHSPREQIERLLAPIRRRVAGIVLRGLVKVVNDGGGVQVVQVDGLEGETLDDLERLQEWGVSGVPPEGSEAIVLFAGGNRDQGFIVACSHREKRPKELKAGEVAVYDDSEQLLHLKSGEGSGDAEVLLKAKVLRIEATKDATIVVQGDATIESEGDVELDAGGDLDLKAGGKITLSAPTVEIGDDTKIDGKDFTSHTHGDVEAGSDNTGDVN